MQTRSDGLKVSNLLNDPSPELVVSGRVPQQVWADVKLQKMTSGIWLLHFHPPHGTPLTRTKAAAGCPLMPDCPQNQDILKLTRPRNNLHSSKQVPDSGPEIYESIAHADRARVYAITTGEYAKFLRILQDTGNTLCGRHPIRVFMTGLKEVERLAKGQGNELKAGRRRFRFTRYERSSDVESVRDSSVSYVSAFAVL